MKELLEHIKRVAIEDFKTFFEPFVWVGRGFKRIIKSLLGRIKSWLRIGGNAD